MKAPRFYTLGQVQDQEMSRSLHAHPEVSVGEGSAVSRGVAGVPHHPRGFPGAGRAK